MHILRMCSTWKRKGQSIEKELVEQKCTLVFDDEDNNLTYRN